MGKLSSLSRDFTAKAKNDAVFWVEHVARHGGASHLRPVTADTTYFEFFCYDILSFIFALLIIVIYLVKFFIKYVMTLIVTASNSKIKTS